MIIRDCRVQTNTVIILLKCNRYSLKSISVTTVNKLLFFLQPVQPQSGLDVILRVFLTRKHRVQVINNYNYNTIYLIYLFIEDKI